MHASKSWLGDPLLGKYSDAAAVTTAKITSQILSRTLGRVMLIAEGIRVTASHSIAPVSLPLQFFVLGLN